MLTKIDWIKSQLLPDEQASECTSRLNTFFETDNPAPQELIPVPIDIDKMWDLVPPNEVFKVLNTLLWDRIVKAIQAGNKALVGKYITALVAGGALSPATVAKIMPALSGTMLDPKWEPRIVSTAARLAGFDDVRVDEVQMILNSEKEVNVT